METLSIAAILFAHHLGDQHHTLPFEGWNYVDNLSVNLYKHDDKIDYSQYRILLFAIDRAEDDLITSLHDHIDKSRKANKMIKIGILFIEGLEAVETLLSNYFEKYFDLGKSVDFVLNPIPADYNGLLQFIFDKPVYWIPLFRKPSRFKTFEQACANKQKQIVILETDFGLLRNKHYYHSFLMGAALLEEFKEWKMYSIIRSTNRIKSDEYLRRIALQFPSIQDRIITIAHTIPYDQYRDLLASSFVAISNNWSFTYCQTELDAVFEDVILFGGIGPIETYIPSCDVDVESQYELLRKHIGAIESHDLSLYQKYWTELRNRIKSRAQAIQHIFAFSILKDSSLLETE